MKCAGMFFLTGILVVGVGCKSPEDDSKRYVVSSVETDSKDPELQYSVRALQLYLAGNWREMLRVSEEWTKSHPKNSEAWMNIGIALNRMGRSESAIPSLRKSVELDPDALRAWNELASALEATGDAQGAEEARAKAAEIDKRLEQPH